MPLSSGIKHQQLFESIIDDDDTMTANHSQASSSHIPIDSATMLLSVFWNASRDLVHNHHQRIAHTMEFLEEQWKIFAHSQWANHWLPEVRYLQGWTLGEIGILVAIFALTSSYYTIRNDRHRRESKQKQKEEHLKEKQISKTNAKKKSEGSRESSSSWLSHPSLDHLPSLPTLDVRALRFSTGTSWERRRQTLAMFSCSLAFVMPATILCWTTVVHLGIFLPFHVFCLRDVDATANDSVIPVLYQFRTVVYALGVWGYMIFATVLDDSPTRGSRIPYVRHALGNWWNYACDFLPVVLVKTADLPATRKEKDGDGKIVDLPCKYILGYHPHGIIAVGAFCAFATDGARVLDLSDSGNENDQNIRQPGLPLRPSSFSLLDDDDVDDDDDDAANNDSSNLSSTTAAAAPLIRRGFSSLFPSLERRIVTLPINFGTPFLREYLMAMGAVTSEKKTFRQYLNSNATVDPDTTGKAMVVVVGGAAESMLAYEGHTQLVLKHRRGFVREAILANASLVPVLGFGKSFVCNCSGGSNYLGT